MSVVGKLNSSTEIIPIQGPSEGKKDKMRKQAINPYFSDPNIIGRVKQYLDEHNDTSYIDVEMMADSLQKQYREYGKRKRSAFRGLVEKAFAHILRSYNISPTTEMFPSSDEELDCDDNELEVTGVNDQLLSLYMRKNILPKSEDKELINISSDEDESKPGKKDKIPPKQKEIQQKSIPVPKIPLLPTPHFPGVSNFFKSSEISVSRSLHPPKRPLAASDRKTINIPKTESTSTAPQISLMPGSSRKRKIEEDLKLGPLQRKKRDFAVHDSQYSFDSVGGISKVLEDVCKLLVHIQHPEIYRQIGVTPPRGFLLHGPPGCGKTLLAQAIAGELQLPMLKIAAPELVAGVSGESEERIRSLFDQAVSLSPCILFLDEIDAITPHRSTAQREMERRIVAQLLMCLDELNQKDGGSGVLIIGATNRPDALDPALRRAGRFDREVSLGIPNLEARADILKVLCKKLRLAPEFSFEDVARNTPGFVGADLMALMREAAMVAVNRVFTELKGKTHSKEGDKLTSNKVPEKEDKMDKKKDQNKDDKIDEKEVQKIDEKEVQKIDEKKDQEIDEKDDQKIDEKDDQKIDEDDENDDQKIDEKDDQKIDQKKNQKKDKRKHKKKGETSKNTDNSNQNNDKVANGKTKNEEAVSTEKVKDEEMDVDVDLSSSQKNIDARKVNPSSPQEKSDNKEENINSKDISNQKSPILETKANAAGVTLTDLIDWLHNQPPLTREQLSELYIQQSDFKEALRSVQPSAKREGFATVPDVTWDDIGSLKDVREELQLAILGPVRYAKQFADLGLSTPTGILLCGPPGCGKTLLAKAIANEAGINFISVKGPELLNMYVGESERAVRQCFQRATNSAPCVIFFDELDALCPKRNDTGEGGASMRVVNQMLTEMDGVESRKGVFLLAATNRPDIIDPAVLRPGRLDKIVYVGLPGPQDRADILCALTKNGTKPRLASEVNLEDLGKSSKCNGYTGADLAALIREAAMESLKQHLKHSTETCDLAVNLEHFEMALAKIRPSISEKDHKHYEKLRKLYTSVPSSIMEAPENENRD